MPIDDPSSESDENPRHEGADFDDSSTFIDRDDETDSGFVDNDYAEDFPGNPSDFSQTNPDPGYAAFASELDDPLADWPSPDAELEKLPEVRLANQTAASTMESEAKAELTAAAETPENVTPINTGPRPQSNTEDRLPEGGELLFPDDGAGDDKFAYPTLVDDDNHADWQATDVDTHHDQTDRDDHRHFDTELIRDIEPVSSGVAVDQSADIDASTGVPDAAGEQDEPLASENTAAILETPSEAELGEIDIPPPAMGGTGFGEADTPSIEAIESSTFDVPEAEAEAEAEDFDSASMRVNTLSTIESSQEDEFVDDFLNDLDPPDDAGSNESFDSADAAAVIPPATREPVSFASYASSGDADNPSASTSENESIWRKIPYGLVAVVILALALLAVGGFGVIQQRTEMQEEIRRLQSQLATTITPEQAQLEREQQRQIEVANESLGAEIEALNAENSELKVQLTEFENMLEERTAQATARAEEQAREAARAEAARLAAQRAANEEAERQRQAAATVAPATPAPAQTTTVAGGWFVNFGSYAQKDVADRWADRLRVEDGQVMVQTASAAGKTLYRVRVVGLQSQDQAERIATNLEREYQLPRLWVGKN